MVKMVSIYSFENSWRKSKPDPVLNDWLRRKGIQNYKKKIEEQKEKELISNIETLESNMSTANLNEIETLKEELQNIRKNKMQGVLVRSRAKIIEEDEKPTTFFCNLEKYNYTSKIVPKLETDDGKIITDQHEILNETKKFYENLYASKISQLIDIDLHELFKNNDIKKLNKDESNSIEGPITYHEAALILKAMSNNRSPGSDGFSAEFLKNVLEEDRSFCSTFYQLRFFKRRIIYHSKRRNNNLHTKRK